MLPQVPYSIPLKEWATRINNREVLYVFSSDYPTLNHAVDAASSKGASGVPVIITPGIHVIQEPIILPHGGANATTSVPLIGMGSYQCVITGGASFPEGRALIEWEPSQNHAWHQHIQGIRFDLPDTAGVKAIHYALHTDDTWQDMSRERLNIVLRDLHIRCHNDYHEVLIDLEGCTWYSEFSDIVGNPVLGDNTYDTLLLRVGTNIWGTEHLLSDAPGLFMCTLRNMHSTWLRGGRSRMFEGRLSQSIWHGGFSDGNARSPAYHFIQGVGGQIVGLSSEGIQEKPATWVFEDCVSMEIVNCSVGSQYDSNLTEEDTYGHGVLMQNCRDMRWRTKTGYPTSATYSVNTNGKRLLYVDEDCQRCVFDNWQVKIGAGEITDEIEIAGDSSNVVHYVAFVNSQTPATTGTLTGGA